MQQDDLAVPSRQQADNASTLTTKRENHIRAWLDRHRYTASAVLPQHPDDQADGDREAVEQLRHSLGQLYPFNVPTQTQVYQWIYDVMQKDGFDYSEASPTHSPTNNSKKWPEIRNIDLVELLSGTANQVFDVTSIRESTNESENKVEANRVGNKNGSSEWLRYLDNNVQDFIIVERGALNDRKVFWNTVIERLSQDMDLLERINNFVWRSGRVVVEHIVSALAGVRLFSVTAGQEGAMHTAKLFLLNVARKHSRRRDGVAKYAGNDVPTHIVVWVNRGTGWDERSTIESPLFRSLITQMSRTAYLRDIEYNVEFHLVIAGRGDTRYILESLGVDTSGYHSRCRVIDSGQLPRCQFKSILREYLGKIANYCLPDKFRERTRMLCSEDITSMAGGSTVSMECINTSPVEDDNTNLDQEESNANSTRQQKGVQSDALRVLCTLPRSERKDVRQDVLIEKYFEYGCYANPEWTATSRAFTESVKQFIERHLAAGSGQRRLDPPLMGASFCPDDWRRPQLLGVLLTAIKHVLEQVVERISHIEYSQAVEEYKGKKHEIPERTWGKGIWNFERLLCQQLEATLEENANKVMSDLGRVDCVGIACAVAYAFARKEMKMIERHARDNPRDQAQYRVNRLRKLAEFDAQLGNNAYEQQLARRRILNLRRMCEDNKCAQNYTALAVAEENNQDLVHERVNLEEAISALSVAHYRQVLVANAAITMSEAELRSVIQCSMNIDTCETSGDATSPLDVNDPDLGTQGLARAKSTLPNDSMQNQSVNDVERVIGTLLAVDMLEIVYFQARLDGEEDEYTQSVRHIPRSYRFATPNLKDILLKRWHS